MAGIFRHFVIALILAVVLFLFFNDNVQLFQLVLFVIGNVIPDIIFAPLLVLKYRTFDAEKIVKKREWKIVSHWDEFIMFIIALCFYFFFISFEALMFLFGVMTHIFIDEFVFEENLWW
jgi:hypothetical protein